MGKHRDKLEEMYQDFDSRFKRVPEDNMKVGIKFVEDKIAENDDIKTHELEEKIATKQALIEALQGKDEAATSPRIQNAINSAKAELKEAQEQLKAQKIRVSRLDKEKRYIQAYIKNKAQIQQIRAFKANMEKKLPAEIKKRDESEAKIKTAETELKEVLKTLSDEKLTMNMMGDEYNNLQIKKESLEKELKEQTEIYKKSKERILELEAKIGKCDLAWKTLFTGKTWDDIQRRALDPNRKFTRKVDENSKLKPENAKGKKLSPEEQMKADIAKTVDDVQKEQQENNGKDKGEG